MSRRIIPLSLFAAFALLVFAAPSLAAISAGNTGWTWSNPQPQGNTLNSVDFSGSRGYGAGAAGTLMRSNDAGATWGSVRSGLSESISLLKTINADSFVFTTGCALRRSDDGGASIVRLPWTSNDFFCSPGIRSFAFPNPDVGYLLLANGAVYSTGDKGQSWALATTLPNTPALGGGAQPGDIHFTSPTEGVATAGNAIYRTTNGGSSWTLVNNTANGQLRRFSFTSALDGFVVGSNSKPLFTNDGGATFTEVAGAPGAELFDVDCATTLLCLARSKDGLTIKRTDDGGISWGSIAPTSLGVNAVSFASATRAVGVGGSGAIVVSDDGGANWTSLHASVNGTFFGLRVKSPSVAYVYGQNGALARTIDGGNSWTRFNVLTTGDVIDADFPNTNDGFALDSNGGLLRSKNGGTSWQVLDTGTTASPRALFAPTATTVALIGPTGVRLSNDAGANFKLNSNRALRRARLSETDLAGSAVFAYGSSSIYRSDAKARTWKPVKGPKRRLIRVLDFVNAKTGFVLDNVGEVWTTRNGGKRWSMLPSTGHNNDNLYLSSMAWGDAKHGYLAGPESPIIYTADGGKTWTEQTALAPTVNSGPLLVATAGAKSAFALRAYSASILSTTTGGEYGSASALKLKPTTKKVRKGSNLKVGGSLSPAAGGELVTIAARPAGAKPGTAWKYANVIVSSTGTFTSVWRINKPMVFVAWWGGSAANGGDGATPVTIKLKKR